MPLRGKDKGRTALPAAPRPPIMDYVRRQGALRERLAAAGLDGLLVSHLPNIRYLCGFSGSNALLLLTSDAAWLFTDGRYREQAAAEIRCARLLVPAGGDLWKAAAARVRGRLGIESDHVTLVQRRHLADAIGARSRGLRLTRGWVEALRAVKEPAEVLAIRRAVELASSVFEPTVAQLRPGITETAWAGALEFALRAAGGEGLAFPTIVASGAHGALVHAAPGSKTIEKQAFVVIDYGVILAGYVSDMTRTVHVGRPGRRARQVYSIVAEAQQAAIAAVRPGVACSAVDGAARRVITRSGFGRNFPHSTGHGLGLEIHEGPRLGRRAPDRLVEGQMITIEPGIYIPGWGGVRIEDVVLVTAQGAEVVTPTSKALLAV